jgi:flavin-dependent dehydrogenase
MSAGSSWDVIVVGAGPGGSSVSAKLAEAGARVLVLEKDEFPRFHIGESLLPAAESVVSVLGVQPDPGVFLFKRGARFVCEATGRDQVFDFNEALPGPQRYAWHVERARFDTMLRDRARALGAEVRHGVRVTDVRFDDAGVEVVCASGEGEGAVERARYFIDASGQGRFLGAKMRSITPLARFGKAAVFTHFSGLSEAARAELGAENDIRIMMVPEGWAWVIPLSGERLSVGLVRREQGIRREDLDAYLEASPLLARVTSGATRGDTHLIGNYSFKNSRPVGARYACVGDAWGFIDPVFSSGVTLAITSGIKVAERLAPALREGREADPELMADIDAYLDRGFEAFCALVDRFYNTRFVDNMIFGAPEDGALRAGVISVFAGNVYDAGDNRFLDMLFASRRRGAAREPATS